MKYNSTVCKKISVSASYAIAEGISGDGGLFVPEAIPVFSMQDFKTMLTRDYNERAKIITGAYLTDFSEEEIAQCVDAAYTAEKFESKNPAPIVKTDYKGLELNILELWHGPTAAFKDMALQLLPHLLTKSYKKSRQGKEAVILVATSGDTGKAALEGFKDVEGTSLVVFYPEKGVSKMQKKQMNVQNGGNLSVCAIRGNFDDAQTGVKNIFTNEEYKKILAEKNMLFSSANSINWGRLLPQIVYYISAYCDMVNSGEIALGDKINIVVPTGNFGNILAAYYAFRMGVPVNRFICASNSNNVLTDFINTGVYDKNREFYTTISPSMDILVSSNLERLLYHISGEDDALIAEYMKSLKQNGRYSVSDKMKKEVAGLFYGGYCDDERTKKTISEMFSGSGYLPDTHTAVAIKVYSDYVNETGDKTKALIASTASPYKFPADVLSAIMPNEDIPENEFAVVDILEEKTGVKIPAPIEGVRDMSIRFNNTVDTDKMVEFVLNYLGV